MESTTPALSNRPAFQSLLIAIASVVSGVSVGVAGGALQIAGVSPWVLYSLAAGGLVAIVLIGISATASLGSPRWPAAVLAAVLVVATQHVWLYRAALENRKREAAEKPAVELFRPGQTEQSFVTYMRSEANAKSIALWTLDACLLVAAAVVIVEGSARRRDSASHIPPAND